MDRRRGGSSRPAPPEEIDSWTHTKKTLSDLASCYVGSETIGRTNRLLSAWPTDDTLPAEGLDSVKTLYGKLSSSLHEIGRASDKEVKAIDAALEQLTVLIALRKAPEASSSGDRNSRRKPPGRASTPSVTPAQPSAAPANGRGVSITLPARSSVGPNPPIPFSREPKARREALARQLPLREGRKVAFHDHSNKSATGEDENTWILAVITKCINADKNRYEVQDPEPQEDGQTGLYNTTLRSIIPLPDPNAPPGDASSLSAYQEFPKGSTVMALYPDTSCFYRAEVVAAPTSKEMQFTSAPTYKLKFEDDEDQEHHVAAQWVVEWPGP